MPPMEFLLFINNHSQCKNDQLEGVIFVGDLPIAECEVLNWVPYERFPCDIYYMDLDGIWEDNAHDGDWSGMAATGVFDGHSGNQLAEIWMSRITAGITPGLGSETDIVNAYFSRVHRRMIGTDPSQKRYLILADDVSFPDEISHANADADLLGYQPGSVATFLKSNNEDTRDNWANELIRGYESAFIMEHSGPTTHNNGYSNLDYINGPTTNTRFYNLFACSNSRYTVPNFLGGLYAWGHNGLISMGCTKILSTNTDYDYYYAPMSTGSSFGESFKNWLNNYALIDYRDRVYCGMTLCGAGTLHFLQKEFQSPNLAGYLSVDNNPLDNNITSEFKIINNEDKAVDISNMNLIYYMYDSTLDVSSMTWDLNYCNMGTSSVSARFEKLPNTYQVGDKKADTKMILSFTHDATIPAHGTLAFQGSLHDQTKQYLFYESDDWSHFVGADNLAENVVLFSNTTNKPVFGNSPEPVVQDYQLSISPNPVVGKAVINFVITDTNLVDQTASVELHDGNGQCHSWTTKLTIATNAIFVDLSNYATGEYSIKLTINNANVASKEFQIIPGIGILSAPAEVSFGNVPGAIEVVLFNTGTKDITISGINIDNPVFNYIAQLPLIIPANKRISFTAIFAPKSDTTEYGVMTIVSDASDAECKVKLTGKGSSNCNLAVTPNPLNTGASISFDIQNSSLNNTTATFSLLRVLQDSSIEPVEEFTSTIYSGGNSIPRPTWDNLVAGNYKLIMRTEGSTSPADECTFVKSPIQYDYNLSVSPTIFLTGAQLTFTMQNPAYINKTAQFNVYEVFRGQDFRILKQQFTKTMISGTNTVDKPDWDYLPSGFHRLEMTVDGVLLGSSFFQKNWSPSTFQLAVSPTVNNAIVTFNVVDTALIGKTALLTCKQNGTGKITQTQVMVNGLNTVTVSSDAYKQLSPGQYKMVLSVYSFDVDSVDFTIDKNTAISVSASSVSFGQAIVGTQKTATITLTNTGNSDALISALDLSKTVFTQNGITPITIAPGVSKVITLTFKPISDGAIFDTLVIVNSADVNVQTIKVPLSGEGVNTTQTFQVTMTPDGNIVGNNIQPQIAIKNTGSQSVDLSDLIIEFYTYDPTLTIANLRCDIYYCTVSGVTTSFSRLPSVMGNETQKADVVTKFSFPSGTLGTNQTLPLQFGMHVADWQYNFNKADDWSQVIGTGNSAPNIVIRSKSSGHILFGTVPGTSSSL